MKLVGSIVTTVALVVWGLVASLFVAGKIWGWFMIPFFNAPELTIPLYFGLGSFFALYIPNKVSSSTTEEGTTYGQLLLQGFIHVTVSRAVILFFAWIAFLFV
jgi:hypothetical protein